MGLLDKLLEKFKINKQTKDLFHRQVRVFLHHADVYFRPQEMGSDTMIKVNNISFGGLALDRAGYKQWPPSGNHIFGKLYLEDFSLDVIMRVVHFTGENVGCEFIKVPKQFHNKLRDFFKIEFSAINLVKIQSDVLKNDIPGTPYYYHSRTGDELYYILSDDKVVFFSVIFDKIFISGGADQPVKVGKLLIDADPRVHGYKRKDSVSWDEEFNQELLMKVERFIDNVAPLSGSHRKALLKALGR